jgi:redox-sensitive bicupin YhaK (pirin superfamily)
MITIRKHSERGKTKTPWLNSQHTFSFAEYYEPQFMGFRGLRVINEDKVEPKMGFARHAHKNMEIISYVIEGALTHTDNLGNSSIVYPGEIQCMSAGTGIEHGEFNNSPNEVLHFLQIWIIPERNWLNPCYQQQVIPQLQNQLILLAAPENKESLIHINQDASLYVAYLSSGKTIYHQLANERACWLQVVRGTLILNNHILITGDGAEITNENLTLEAIDNCEFLLFDLK